jgi:hypothetical protein
MNGVLERRQALWELTIGWSAWPAQDQDGSTENVAGNAPILVGSSFAKLVNRNALWHMPEQLLCSIRRIPSQIYARHITCG